MLVIECQEYYDEVSAFADTQPPEVKKTLEDNLEFLRTFGCPKDGSDPNRYHCGLYKDFAPYSFLFSLRRRLPDSDEYERDVYMQGGLIFYAGAEGGSGHPQLSVRVGGGGAGWQINS